MINRFDAHNTDAVDAYFETEYYGRITGPSVNFINNISLAMISVFGSLSTSQAEFRWAIFHRLYSIPANSPGLSMSLRTLSVSFSRPSQQQSVYSG